MWRLCVANLGSTCRRLTKNLGNKRRGVVLEVAWAAIKLVGVSRRRGHGCPVPLQVRGWRRTALALCWQSPRCCEEPHPACRQFTKYPSFLEPGCTDEHFVGYFGDGAIFVG